MTLVHCPRRVLGFLSECHLATLTTLRADGTPHVVPVGFAFEPEAGLGRVITGAGSQKAANAARGAGRWSDVEIAVDRVLGSSLKVRERNPVFLPRQMCKRLLGGRTSLLPAGRGTIVVTGTCVKHRAATQLACARCGTPICPRCLVRTPVGFKCSPCSGQPGDRPLRGDPRVALAVLLTASVVAIPLGVRHFAGQDSSRPPPEALALGPEAGLGDEVRDGDLTFVAESFSCDDDSRPAPGDAPPTQGCLLFLSGVNHGASPAELFGRLQYVVDDAGRRYGPEEGILEPFLEILNPDEEGRLTLAFFVPAGAEIEELEVHSYPGSLGARIRTEPASPQAS